ncbi:hypothetical protein ASZ90_004726 [hydrocarbon metagenome]|uniref:Outer membrane protein beta-barrel domain-containing protein n=1 Tax=hydrocarbon metagenome TaxID=938273 RepID=A0A0W8FX89_9ZZZZ
MKNSYKLFSFVLVMSLLFLSPSLKAQTEISFGANVGYGGLNMTDFNDATKKGYEEITNQFSNYSVSQEDVGGGVYFDGHVLFTFNKSITTGLSVNYISGSGGLEGTAGGTDYTVKLDVSTIEILGVLGTKIPFGSSTALALKGYAGVGLPSFDLNAGGNNGSAGDAYFSGRLQGGVEFDLNSVILNAFVGYRIANAGAQEFEINGQKGKFEVNGEEKKLDLSGLLLGVGIDIKF